MSHSARTPMAGFMPKIQSLVTLVALVALAWFGHSHHWKLPKFSSLLKGGGATQGGPPAEAADTYTLRVVRREGGEAGQLPTLQFSSLDALRRVGVEPEEVKVRPIDEFVDAHGVVAYNENRLAQLSSRLPGTVFRVEKHVGQSVKKGDVLALIDAGEVGRAKSTFLQEVVSAEHKAKNLERLTSVTGVVAERQIREAEAELREARIRRFNAQQTLTNLGLPVKYDENTRRNDEELEEQMHFLGIPAEITETLDQKTTTANLLPLRSPFDGVVIQREVVVGEVVDSTLVQFVVADVSTMWIKLDVRKEDVQRMDIGQDIVFHSDSSGEVHGLLKWISTGVGEKTRTVQARADADNPLLESAGADASEGQRLLRANTFGTAHIHVRHIENAITVPKEAVQWLDVLPVVFVMRSDEKVIEPRKVTLGATHEGHAEIRTGVQPGEMVVALGSHLIKAEMQREAMSTP